REGAHRPPPAGDRRVLLELQGEPRPARAAQHRARRRSRDPLRDGPPRIARAALHPRLPEGAGRVEARHRHRLTRQVQMIALLLVLALTADAPASGTVDAARGSNSGPSCAPARIAGPSTAFQ